MRILAYGFWTGVVFVVLLRTLVRRRFFKVAVVLATVSLFLYIVPVPSVGEPVEALAHDWG
ncbi:MAG: hypothetical protein QXF17_04460 [Ignisphaera sp.]